MSQITEQSIKEVGEIKLVNLSYKKVRLDYMVDIICQEITFQSIKIKVKYRLDDDGIYKMYYPNSFLNILSNKFRVKKGFIHYGEIWRPFFLTNNTLDTGKYFELYGLKFNNFIKSIHISDEEWFKTWNRDKQLNEILK
jgi:hypothetical protein